MLIVITKLVAVFDDAANPDVGHGEDLRHYLQALTLLDELFVRFSSEGDDGAVGVNGSALDVVDGKPAAAAAAGEAQLDVAVLLAALGEDLEADVDCEHGELVVGGLFAKELDGGGAGRRGLGGRREPCRECRGPRLGGRWD